MLSRDAAVPEMLMRVVSILPPLAEMLSMKVGPPVRLILDKLTFTNSRLILKESFLPVTEDGSSSTVPAEEAFSNSYNLIHNSHQLSNQKNCINTIRPGIYEADILKL